MKQIVYGLNAKGKTLAALEYPLSDLAPNQVRIKIHYCGVCHSDLHMMDNDWGDSCYPMVPGHEIVGEVVALGALVQNFHLHEMVGASWQQGACGHCHYCQQQEPVFCPEIKAVGLGLPGGFAEFIDVAAAYVFPLPHNIDYAKTAPLLCAGATVFHALQVHGIKPGMRIGIVGIGGLGHLAIQYAKALGAEVIAFDLRKEIEKDAKALGAVDFICPQEESFSCYYETLDFILSTVPEAISYEPYIRLLKPKSTLCLIGIPKEPLSLSVLPLVIGQKSLSAVPLGNPLQVKEALAFAFLHGVYTVVEIMPLAEINFALERLRQNKVHYRIVMKAIA